MVNNFALSAYLICVGLAAAGAGTYLYQLVFRQQAMLRIDGKNYFGTLGHLFMSFVCGPFIMLQLGWSRSISEGLSKGNLLLASLVAFGWSFFTGMLFLTVYLSMTG